MKRYTKLTLIFLLAIAAACAAAAEESTQAILERFAADYQSDINLREDAIFGIRVDQEMWTVDAQAAGKEQPARVDLHKGEPDKPTFFYFLNKETLLKLDRRELNGLTAQAKAFSSDEAPMDIDVLNGFQPDAAFVGKFLDISFHFWNRGTPEVILYGDSHTRFTHGADLTVFYYAPGLRTGWGSLKKGMHANADPKSQINEFPSLFIFTRGKGMARVGGKELEVREGQSLLVPKGVAHEFWNDNNEALELILIMFGEGA